MISLSSSDVSDRSIAETSDDNGLVDEDDDAVDVVIVSNLSIWAAFVAAACTSRGLREMGRGSKLASSGKLRIAELPLMLKAATSWARAAISGVGNVPSQMRDFFRGSRISETHLPQFLMRTPRYTGCLPESRRRLIFLSDSAGRSAEFWSPVGLGAELRDESVHPVGEEGEDGGEESELELVSRSELDDSIILSGEHGTLFAFLGDSSLFLVLGFVLPR